MSRHYGRDNDRDSGYQDTDERGRQARDYDYDSTYGGARRRAPGGYDRGRDEGDYGGYSGRYRGNYGISSGSRRNSDYNYGDDRRSFGYGRIETDYMRYGAGSDLNDDDYSYGGRDYDHSYGSERYGSRSDHGRYNRGYETYGRGYEGRRGGEEERGWWDRASDEVASWFGDEEAERRRRMDEMRERSHRGRGPKNYRRSDERIREDINDRLTDDPYIDASDIEVSVNDRDVVLTGTVESRRVKHRAGDIAESVTGVSNVENRLRVRRAAATGMSDSTIAGTTGSDAGAEKTGASTTTTARASTAGGR